MGTCRHATDRSQHPPFSAQLPLAWRTCFQIVLLSRPRFILAGCFPVQRPGAKSLENQGQIVVHLPVMSSQADVTNSLNISVAANWTSCAVVGNSNSLKGAANSTGWPPTSSLLQVHDMFHCNVRPVESGRSNSLPTWSLWDTNCQLGHASPGGDYVMSLSCCPVAGPHRPAVISFIQSHSDAKNQPSTS